MMKRGFHTKRQANLLHKFNQSNIFLQQNRIIEIPDCGEIGAGKVVPFPHEEGEGRKQIKIPMPSNVQDGDVLFSHSVSGDSLNDFEKPERSINNGDSLICKANCEIWEVTPDKICIVFIHRTCEKLAKKVIYVNENDVILRSPNPYYKDRHFPADEIEIKGIVIGFKRLWS